MKFRTAAVVAAVLIPLMALGTGVFVAASKSRNVFSAQMQARAEQGRRDALRAGGGPETYTRRSPRKRTTPRVGDRAGAGEIRPSQSRVLEVIDRIAVAQGKIPALKLQARDSLTEAEGVRLQLEVKALEDQVKVDIEELKTLSAIDPAPLVDFVRTWRHHVVLGALEVMIWKTVEGSIEAERSLSGPLLKELLTLVNGDSEDRLTFLKPMGWLKQANRDVAQACLEMLRDEDSQVRANSIAVLWTQAGRGHLKETLTERAGALQAAASDTDGLIRGRALETLAFVGSPELDEFVLNRFESCQTGDDVSQLWRPMLLVAPRVAERNEERLVAAFKRALSLPLESPQVGLAAHAAYALSPSRCVEVLEFAISRLGPDQVALVESYRGIIKFVENGGISKLRESLNWQRQLIRSN